MQSVIKMSKERSGTVSHSDLSFATKFVAVCFFIKVKSSRPMTNQYLTWSKELRNTADLLIRKKFKTRANYAFDSLLLTKTSLKLLNGYISDILPLLKATCKCVLVHRNGVQHGRIGQLISKMVFDATGKYIHPTRYRQNVETASHEKLIKNEQDAFTEDQQHSSVVASVHYQKRKFRQVATRAHDCLRKLQWTRELS